MANDETTAVRFEGFTPEALRLLAGLARNNTRAWFAPRKERIGAELLEPMAALVESTSAALERAKIGIRGNRKRSIFRIYRDVRFARDKAPYRTSLAAYLSYDGERDSQGGIYVQIEPTSAHLSVAFYRVPPPMLLRWRREMAARPARFKRVLAQLEMRGLAVQGPESREDSLARMPRGYEGFAQHELAPYFRLRSFVVRRDLTPAEVTSERFVPAIVALARDAKPLLNYGWALI